LAPGGGATLAGGEHAIDNDGGMPFPGGPGRYLPPCSTVEAWHVFAPMVAAPGTTFNVVVTDLFAGGPCVLLASFGSVHMPVVPGVNGHVFVNLATATVVGVGTTNATFPIALPANPTLAGLALTCQAIVTSGSASPITGTSEARNVSIR
jgi:hypothetical protein